MWNAKEPSLLNGYECSVIAMSSYKWKIVERNLMHHTNKENSSKILEIEIIHMIIVCIYSFRYMIKILLIRYNASNNQSKFLPSCLLYQVSSRWVWSRLSTLILLASLYKFLLMHRDLNIDYAILIPFVLGGWNTKLNRNWRTHLKNLQLAKVQVFILS